MQQETPSAKFANMLDSLNERANLVYDFTIMYYEFIHTKHDYGTGELLSVMDVHTLTYIEENPGVTITQLSLAKNKTKSAFSQCVKRLVNDGYVIRIKCKSNPRVAHLYATEKGVRLSMAHKLYDVSEMSKTMAYLTYHCTEEELDTFYKVLRHYHNYHKDYMAKS